MAPVADAPTPVARAYTPTALPSVTARLLAFLAIVLGGFSGGLIGYSVADLQCGGGDEVLVLPSDPDERPATTVTTIPPDETGDDSGCTTIAGVGGVIGALVGAAGVAVVAVLVLRAMAEWRRELEVEEDPGAAPGP